MSINIDAIAYAVDPRAKQGTNGEYAIHCPIHQDSTPSATISEKDGTILVHCQVCGRSRQKELWDAVVKLAGHLLPQRGSTPNATKRTYTHYVYTNEHGAPLYRAVRVEPGKRGKKDFYQQTYSPGFVPVEDWKDKDWQNGILPGTRYVLYRLPDLLQDIQSGKRIFVVEGEKSTDFCRERGLAATTNVQGGENWRPEYNDYFTGQDVVICPDNDDKGRAHAELVASQLSPIAKSVKVVALPGAAQKDGLDDWLKLHSIDELDALVGATSDFQTTIPAAASAGLPIVDISSGDLGAIVDEIWGHVLSAHPDRMYRVGNNIAAIDDGLQMLDVKQWRSIVARCCRRVDTSPKKVKTFLWKTSDPEIQDSMLVFPKSIPNVKRVASLPTLVPDGKETYRLIDADGYDEPSGVYHQRTIDLPKGDMPLDKALSLVEDLLGDFPFASQSDKANAIALLLLPFVRGAINGATPMHLVEAATPGTGKGLLVSLFHLIWQGKYPRLYPALPKDDNEASKILTSILMSMPETIIFDNVNAIGGAALDMALTAQIYSGRILGKTEMSNDLPNNAAWIATGNNVSLLGDVHRRVVPIRLIADCEDPSLREGFKIKDITGWALAHRAELVKACLTIINEGLLCCPNGFKAQIMGSFEGYSRLLGKVLAGCQIEGFLGNLERIRNDENRNAWRRFVAVWYQAHQTDRVVSRELYALLEQETNITLPIRGDNDKARVVSFGKQLQKQVDKVYSLPGGVNVRIVASYDSHTKQNGFALEIIEKTQTTRRPPADHPQGFKASQSGVAVGAVGCGRFSPHQDVTHARTRAHAHACVCESGENPPQPTAPTASLPTEGITKPNEVAGGLRVVCEEPQDLPQDLPQVATPTPAQDRTYIAAMLAWLRDEAQYDTPIDTQATRRTATTIAGLIEDCYGAAAVPDKRHLKCLPEENALEFIAALGRVKQAMR